MILILLQLLRQHSVCAINLAEWGKKFLAEKGVFCLASATCAVDDRLSGTLRQAELKSLSEHGKIRNWLRERDTFKRHRDAYVSSVLQGKEKVVDLVQNQSQKFILHRYWQLYACFRLWTKHQRHAKSQEKKKVLKFHPSAEVMKRRVKRNHLSMTCAFKFLQLMNGVYEPPPCGIRSTAKREREKIYCTGCI